MKTLLNTSDPATIRRSRYDTILIGSGPVNLIEAMCLTKQGKKVLVVEQGDHVGGAWGKVHLNEDWPDFQLGCHIWDVEPEAFEFLSEFLDMEFVPLRPQPKFILGGMQFPYDWKYLLFFFRGKLMPNCGKEKAKFKKVRILPAKYVYPSGGSLQFIDRLLEKVEEFGIDVKRRVKISNIEIGQHCRAVSDAGTFEADEVVLTSVSQLRTITHGTNKIEFPEPRIFDYIHGHFLINDPTPSRFSYVRVVGDPVIHRITDETDHVTNHGVEMSGRKLVIAGVHPSVYSPHKQDELAETVLNNLFKRRYISKNATLDSHHWNVFSTHYIPNDIRPEIAERFRPQIRLLHTTNLIFSIRDNCERWARTLLRSDRCADDPRRDFAAYSKA